jgi:hypothetical protein
MDKQRIEAGDGGYPTILRDRLGDAAPACTHFGLSANTITVAVMVALVVFDGPA